MRAFVCLRICIFRAHINTWCQSLCRYVSMCVFSFVCSHVADILWTGDHQITQNGPNENIWIPNAVVMIYVYDKHVPLPHQSSHKYAVSASEYKCARRQSLALAARVLGKWPERHGRVCMKLCVHFFLHRKTVILWVKKIISAYM